MMPKNKNSLPVDDLRRALLVKLNKAEIRWYQLCEDSTQLILFGSQATGNAKQGSDWDLLAVGNQTTLKKSGIDLIWVTEKFITTNSWLGSELANHIAEYGIWLDGSDTWSSKTFISQKSLDDKLSTIQRGYSNLLIHSANIAPQFIERRFIKLRRDLQRLKTMQGGCAVPPTSILDQEWVGVANKQEFLQSLLDRVNIQLDHSIAALLAKLHLLG